MLTIIWVLGSMLLMLLIHFLLPLGYTKKGKLIVVVTSGLLAMGGLAAVSALPVWQTILVLLALSFFASYIMDGRLGKVMYLTNEKFLDEVEFEFEDNPSSFNVSNQTEKTLDIELMDLSELEITASSSTSKRDENTASADSLEEDISFLQERDLEGSSGVLKEDEVLEVGYLSDIESLLEASTHEKVDLQDDKLESLDEGNWLDELAELTVIKEEEKSSIIEPELDDFELDELFALKEVAATTDKDDSKPKKVLELQKK
ncbi:hypothetical protein [Neobacillus sp. CF12]|uniref:hypothetical protein n=1 Tax=Neobacillus sp. CF12 TaxID=3055864 RepID=UPI00259FFBD6|nr:hypothetical protein [Neobacillus sp. CF12]MDM5330831.1 hypothetical protein [Neobacillus sp. CF12]